MRSLLFSDLRLKLFALAFAFALWFFVRGQSGTEVGFIIPLGVKNTPRHLVIAGKPPDEVEVRVSGPKLLVGSLSPSQLTASVDLGGAKEGVNPVRLSLSDIVAPIGVEVLRVKPSHVEFILEKVITAELKVSPRITGRPAAGFKVHSVTANPASVTAKGTKKELSDLREVFTKPIDISGAASSRSVTVPLDAQDMELKSLNTDKAEMKIIIKREK